MIRFLLLLKYDFVSFIKLLIAIKVFFYNLYNLFMISKIGFLVKFFKTISVIKYYNIFYPIYFYRRCFFKPIISLFVIFPLYDI